MAVEQMINIMTKMYNTSTSIDMILQSKETLRFNLAIRDPTETFRLMDVVHYVVWED